MGTSARPPSACTRLDKRHALRVGADEGREPSAERTGRSFARSEREYPRGAFYRYTRHLVSSFACGRFGALLQFWMGQFFSFALALACGTWCGTRHSPKCIVASYLSPFEWELATRAVVSMLYFLNSN